MAGLEGRILCSEQIGTSLPLCIPMHDNCSLEIKT